MRKTVLSAAALMLLSAQAEARPYHHLYRVQHFREAMAMAPSGGERVVGGRPAGCPNAFCGCEASLYKFGRIVPGLNLASNWRRFPRATPAPGMAAVRSGHVMILESQVGGNVWTVHDGNSGGHVTREHPRSLAGYTIVDPNGHRHDRLEQPDLCECEVGQSGFRQYELCQRELHQHEICQPGIYQPGIYELLAGLLSPCMEEQEDCAGVLSAALAPAL